VEAARELMLNIAHSIGLTLPNAWNMNISY
jgi:hypothetical protein